MQEDFFVQRYISEKNFRGDPISSFHVSFANRQTDRQTERQTNAAGKTHKLLGGRNNETKDWWQVTGLLPTLLHRVYTESPAD